jgi:hypothetical protein
MEPQLGRVMSRYKMLSTTNAPAYNAPLTGMVSVLRLKFAYLEWSF